MSYGEIKNTKDIKIGANVYKIVSHNLNKKQWESYKKETKKVEIKSKIYQKRRKYMFRAI